jgi:hypothetical protein
VNAGWNGSRFFPAESQSCLSVQKEGEEAGLRRDREPTESRHTIREANDGRGWANDERPEPEDGGRDQRSREPADQEGAARDSPGASGDSRLVELGEGGQRVTAEATVLDLSEQGAAVLADRAPAVSQTVWLCPQSSSGAGPAWEARSVAISEVPSGK